MLLLLIGVEVIGVVVDVPINSGVADAAGLRVCGRRTCGGGDHHKNAFRWGLCCVVYCVLSCVRV